jgi:predicted PurR-regulated permease PerM
MLGFNRRAASYTFTAAMVLLGFCLVYLVRSTIFVFTLAILFAFLLSPFVNILSRILPRRSHTAALALAYVIALAIVGLFVNQIGARIVNQAETLNKRLPDILAGWRQPESAAGPVSQPLKDELIGKLRVEAARRSGELFAILPRYGVRVLTAAGDLIYLVIIPILAFFLLKDAPLIRNQLLAFAPEGSRRELLNQVMADIEVLLAGYMRALVGLTLVAFAVYGVFFAILGVPYGILLAAIAGVLEFIPMMGPLTASAIILLAVGVAGSHLLPVLIFLPVFRIMQDDVISPRLMQKGVNLHPLLVLFGVFSGSGLAGIAGTFLSVPLLALIRILYLRLWKGQPGTTAI